MGRSSNTRKASRVRLLLFDVDGVLTALGLRAVGVNHDGSVDLVTRAHGGHGAARELIEFVLRAQDRWNSLVAEYGVSGR